MLPHTANKAAPAHSANVPGTTTSNATLVQVKHEEPAPPPRLLPKPAEQPADRFPIDLVTALRLSGANNLQIALAAERVQEAQARLQGANALWLPTVTAGVGYNKHEGRIQDTQGQVLEVSRNSVYVGGGPAIGPAPLNGPAGGPPRLFVGIPLADAFFTPLVARQEAQAANAANASTFNDTLLQVGLAYLDLQFAQGQVGVAQETVKNARELVRVVENQVKAGAALPADGLRAQAELADRHRQEAQAQEAVRVTSAELARLLRLDPAVTLFPADVQPVPIDFVSPAIPLPDLIAQGLSSRPETEERLAVVNAAEARRRQERWRPWVPAVQLGLSAGGFGGGEGGDVRNFSDRLDFDALMVWELRNLGVGNQSLRRQRDSQYRQANLDVERVQDFIAMEVARAYHQVQYRRQQMEAASTQARTSAEAVPLNFKGIVEKTIRAIEALQAIQSLAGAQAQYLAAIIGYNRAQLELLRAIGQPLEAAVCSPLPGASLQQEGTSPPE